MSKSIYINDMRRDIDEGGGGGGATSADQVSYNGGTVKGALDTVRGDLNTFQFRMNEGSGEYKLESEGADSWRPFKSDAMLELLWENPNPGIGFAPQTLDIDWSKYKYLIIECIYADSASIPETVRSSLLFWKGDDNMKKIVANDWNSSTYHTTKRDITLADDKKSITFGIGAYSSSDKSNGYCIPTKIYGMS